MWQFAQTGLNILAIIWALNETWLSIYVLGYFTLTPPPGLAFLCLF